MSALPPRDDEEACAGAAGAAGSEPENERRDVISVGDRSSGEAAPLAVCIAAVATPVAAVAAANLATFPLDGLRTTVESGLMSRLLVMLRLASAGDSASSLSVVSVE